MDGAVDDMYAVESYFLGKKVYYDKLESKDKNWHKISSDHIRMRGIPTPCIKYSKARKNRSNGNV